MNPAFRGAGYRQIALMPPSMTSSLPTVNIDSSDARNTTALAISSGSPTRSLELPRWSYQTQSDAEFVLVWGADERLVSIEATPDVRALVVHTP